MKSILKAVGIAVFSLLFAACATTSGPASLHQQLMTGQWEGEMQGFPLVLEYTETDIVVVGMGMSLPYQLDGDEMTFDVPGMGSMTVKIAIDGDTLTQTEVTTGQVSTLVRRM